MTPYYQTKNGVLYHGDCAEVLSSLGLFDACVTDPPYGLKFMGKKWDYSVPSVETWTAIFDHMKPGAHLLSFAGTRTQHRMAVNIEDAGFEIRNMIAWVYGSGFPKSHDVSKALDKMAGAIRTQGAREWSGWLRSNNSFGGGSGQENGTTRLVKYDTPVTPEAKQWEGFGSSLKPAIEPITLARKPLDGTIAENVLKWGCGALDIDGSRIATHNEDLGRNNNARIEGTSYVVQKETMRIDNSCGKRYPSNLIHDGSDEVLAMFPSSQSKESQRGKVQIFKKEKGGIGESTLRGHNDSGSAARFFYTAKASRSERGEGNTHATVKPIALMLYLVRLVSRDWHVVLDPFFGSGTTAVACERLNRKWIGIELSEQYCEIAAKRIEAETKQLKLF